jgi:hypothetical protein
MKKMLILSFLISVKLFAQSEENTDAKNKFLSIKVGLGQISGDGTSKSGVAAGVEYEKQMSKLLTLGASLDFGKLNGNPYKGYTYTSEVAFWQLGAKLKFDILSKSKFKVLPFLGIAYTGYNPKVSDGGKVIRFANGTADSPKSVGSFCVPVGAEFAVNLKKGRIGLEIANNYLLSDRFDGTIGIGSGGSFDGHTFKGKIVDLKKGSPGKTKNDEWMGIRLKYTILLGK